jgi:hypothetical protein
MHLTPDAVVREYEWTREQAPTVVDIANDVRAALGEAFDRDPGSITIEQYHDAIDAVYGDGDLAVNVAALTAVLRDLDVDGDYPGFVVDEVLARELAGMVAGTQPLRLLGEATFHYADVTVHHGETAGADDLYAALAAGIQTRVPGWEWRTRDAGFAVEEA